MTVPDRLGKCALTKWRAIAVRSVVLWSPRASDARLANAVLESKWRLNSLNRDPSHHLWEEAEHLGPDWKRRTRRMLIEIRGDSPAWSYRRRGSPCVEPTSLACLGLLASALDDDTAEVTALLRRAADWTAAIQQADGSLPVSPSLLTSSWSTPYAVLLWSKLTGYELRGARKSLDVEGRERYSTCA